MLSTVKVALADRRLMFDFTIVQAPLPSVSQDPEPLAPLLQVPETEALGTG